MSEKEKEVVVGIDLGTTNSCIAIWDKYKVEVIQNDYGERTTPSIVHFFDDNNYCIGSDAKIFLNQYPKSTIYSIKRVIGLNFESEEVSKFKKNWPFNLIKQDRDKIGIEIDTNHSKFIVDPETISCYVLKKLKADAEKFLKNKIITKAVVAVPHYFNTSQKEATMSSAKMAGFEDIILINEPTAASMAFSLDKILDNEEKKLIIFDLGGGTFDVSLLTIEEGIIDVICVNGDTKLGGNDIDEILFNYVKKKIKGLDKYKNMIEIDEIIYQQKEKIKSKCEFVKINLTNQETSVLNLQNFYKNENISIEITRQELENECKDFLSKIKNILDELFKDAKSKKKSNSYSKSKIDYIILIGGATKMPIIINFVKNYFGKEPITSFNPDETVAIGAALRGETLFNNSPYLDSLHLIDVIPLNIGVMVDLDKKMDVILKRNSYIPSTKKKIYYPYYDDQSAVEINVFEGENKYTKDNILLGKFNLDIIPKKSKDSQIEITFTIDEHLFLHVTAEQLFEGKSIKVCIKKKNQLLTNDELEKEKIKIEKSRMVTNMNENEKKIYSQILSKKQEFFSTKIIKKSEIEVDEFINLIENYFSVFKIKENNIHFMNLLFRLYNIYAQKEKTENILKEKIDSYFEQISRIDIFYILNFISKFILEKYFQEKLTIKIAFFFYNKGISYLIDNFNENKKIAYELFQISIQLIDNILTQNKELKDDSEILELIKDNNIGLNKIKINNISLKIKDIYDINGFYDEKYINQIIELYQTMVSLIENKDEIKYINNFEILYRLGDNNDYLPYILEIMDALYIYIKEIIHLNDDEFKKYKEFKHKLDELKKYSEGKKNINQDYFIKDFNDSEFKYIENKITKRYNEEKENPTNFVYDILDKYPPISLPKSLDDFKKNPNIKILVASYSTSFNKKFSILKNKEKLREKIHSILTEMFSNNVELKSVNGNGEETDNEDNNEDLCNDNESRVTNYT